MHLTDVHVLYIAAVVDTLIVLYLISLFNTLVLGWMNDSFSKGLYVKNALTIRETGQPHPYFLESKLPDPFHKWIITRQIFSLQLLVYCFMIGSVLVIIQFIISGILLGVIPYRDTHVPFERCFFTLVFIDYALLMSSGISVINTYFKTLRNELNGIRSTVGDYNLYNSFYHEYETWFESHPKKMITKDQAVDMIKNLQVKLSVMHLQKKGTDEKNNNN